MLQKSEKHHSITLIDACVLLHNMLEGLNVDTVGFEDIEHNIWEMRRKLNRRFDVPESVLESALWSCNLMSEQGLFWHPDGKKFATLVKDVTPDGMKFDKLRNYFYKAEA